MDGYRIILADDHAMVRHGIKRIIEESEHLTVIAEAENGIELLNLLKKLKPHMVILDISMPNLSGLEATREIKCLFPDIKVLILSLHKNEGYLHHALAAGCDGYLLKEDAYEEFLTAVDNIRKGELYISPGFSEPMGRCAWHGPEMVPTPSKSLSCHARQALPSEERLTNFNLTFLSRFYRMLPNRVTFSDPA